MKLSAIETGAFQPVKEKIVFLEHGVPRVFSKRG
jgi:hypothetical protein